MENNHKDNEFRVFEFLKLLKDGWAIFLVIFFISLTVAFSYIKISDEIWSSTLSITTPEITDYYELSSALSIISPVFITEDNEDVTSEAFNNLTNSKHLFDEFIDLYNLQSNKVTFLRKDNNLQKYFQINDDVNDQFLASLLSSSKISLNSKTSYQLKAIAFNQRASTELLQDYVKFVSSEVNNQIINEFNLILSIKSSTLVSEKKIRINQAKKDLELEESKIDISLKIAKEAKISQPIENIEITDGISFNLGKDVLHAKKESLSKLEDRYFTNSHINEITSKLEVISSMNSLDEVNFKTYKNLGDVAPSPFRDSPKNKIIFGLSIIFSVLLFGFVTLIRYIWK